MKQDSYLIHVREWQKYLEDEGYSQYTIEKSYRNPVMKAYRMLKEMGKTGVRNITKEEAQYIVTEGFRNSPYSLAAWKNFLNYCGNGDVLDGIKTNNPKNKRTKVDWLDLDRGEDFIVWKAAVTPLERALVHMELHLGLRRTSVARFQMKWYKGTHLDVLGKGRGKGKQRTVPAHEYTAEVMREMKEYRDELIRMAGNPPEVPPNMMLYLKNGKLGVYKNTALDNILKGVLTRVQKIHPEMKFSHHTLRRTAGRAMWKAGAPMETIAEILGHNNTIVTKKYIGVNFDDTQNAMRLMVEYNKKREIGLSSPVAG